MEHQQTQPSHHERDLAIIRSLRLIDDDFMKLCFDGNIPLTEYTLRILLDKPDLRVLSVKAEYVIPNLYGHGVRFDVYAEDASGRSFDIEIQRADKGASPKRARYNSSIIDAHAPIKGEEYERLPESYVIFITERDVLGLGLPLYHIERHIEEAKRRFGDEAHILYANASYRGNDPLGELMHDFMTANPDEMRESPLKETISRMKNTPEGVSDVCKLIEDMLRENAVEERKNMATLFIGKLLKKKFPLSEISEMVEMPVEEVERLAREAGFAI